MHKGRGALSLRQAGGPVVSVAARRHAESKQPRQAAVVEGTNHIMQ